MRHHLASLDSVCMYVPVFVIHVFAILPPSISWTWWSSLHLHSEFSDIHLEWKCYGYHFWTNVIFIMCGKLSIAFSSPAIHSISIHSKQTAKCNIKYIIELWYKIRQQWNFKICGRILVYNSSNVISIHIL